MIFYVGILAISLIFSVQPFLKKEILNYFTADEYTIINSILGLLLFLTKYFYSSLDFGNIFDKNTTSYFLILVASSMTICYSFLLNLLLQTYKPGQVMPFIRCCELIWILLITLFFNFKEFTMIKLFGTIIAAIGVYLAS